MNIKLEADAVSCETVGEDIRRQRVYARRRDLKPSGVARILTTVPIDSITAILLRAEISTRLPAHAPSSYADDRIASVIVLFTVNPTFKQIPKLKKKKLDRIAAFF